jgi:polar amino acid transport system substrate-binding protein
LADTSRVPEVDVSKHHGGVTVSERMPVGTIFRLALSSFERPSMPRKLIFVLALFVLTACSDNDDATADDDIPAPGESTAETAAETTELEPEADSTPGTDPTPDTYGSLAGLVPDELEGSTLILGIPPEAMRSDVYLEDDGESFSGPLPDLLQAAADLLGLPTEQREFDGGDELEESYLDGEPAVYLVAATMRGFPVDLADIIVFAEYDDRFLLREGLEIGDEPTDLCGLRIGRYEPENGEPVLSGYFAEMSGYCESSGNPLEIVPFAPDDALPSEAVASGEIDAAPMGEVMGARAIDESPWLTLGGPVTERRTTSFIAGKEHGLAEPIAQALDELAANGTYEDIMASYGLPNVAPTEPMVNVVD